VTDVTLRNVWKRYEDDVLAVEDLSLRVEDGEFVVVVGPSGCGKSTTLRLIAGLETATEGTIEMGDRDVTDVEPKDRNVAMVFQNYALYPHMTARRNITFGMDSSGSFTEAEVETRVEEAAELLDIADLMDRKPAALSGGERQRVALGRAIVRDPDVFLLDEPLSNLDAKLRIRMRSELAKLHDRLRTTTVYVTHDQTEAMTLGDRVVVMHDGEVQQVDPPQRLYDYPANRFVAEFIGDPAMNVLPVRVEERPPQRAAPDGSRSVAVHEGFEVPLPEAEGLAAAVGGDALLGVRPEDLHLAAEATGTVETGEGTAPGSFAATVEVTEPLGDSLLLGCRVGGDEFRASVSPRSGIEPGETVDLVHDPARLHLFDAGSGGALYHSADGDRPVEAPGSPDRVA
jgi:multiple sugar transport system ATP-binding protein